jgi:hypothetical protein
MSLLDGTLRDGALVMLDLDHSDLTVGSGRPFGSLISVYVPECHIHT